METSLTNAIEVQVGGYAAGVGSGREGAAPAPARRQLDALTGLRFVAALQVLAFHAAQRYLGGAPAAVRNVVGSGYVGVSLFFVLSGFILTYNYLDACRAGRLNRRSFWGARFARVYPVYLVGLAVALPFFIARVLREGAGTGAAAPFVLTLTQAWIPRYAIAWNIPAWSLSVEALFYAVFPFVLPLLIRLRFRWLLALVVGLWLLSLAPALALLGLHPERYLHLTAADRSVALDLLRYHPLSRVPEFLLGMVVGRMYVDGDTRRGGGLLTGAAAAVVLVVLTNSDRVPYVLLHNGLLALPLAALIYSLASGSDAVARLLASRPLRLLGESSYALYILHVPVGTWLAWTVVTRGWMTIASPAFLLLNVGVTLAVSIAVYRWVEEPSRRRLRALLVGS